MPGARISEGYAVFLWAWLHFVDVLSTQILLHTGRGMEANAVVAVAMTGGWLLYLLVILAGFAVFPLILWLGRRLGAPRPAVAGVALLLLITKAWTVANNLLILLVGHGLPPHPLVAPFLRAS